MSNMSNKLKKIVTAILLTLLFFPLFNTQKVEAADVTVQDLLGKWDAQVKINQLELKGTWQEHKDLLYKQAQGPQIVNFSMLEGKLAINHGSGQTYTTKVPVTLSGSKLSGTTTVQGWGTYIIEVTLEGTVRKSAKGIEFSINELSEIKDKKQGVSIISYTYTNTTADFAPSSKPPVAEEPAEVEEQAVEEVIPLESITIEPGLFRLKVGAKRQLNVKIKPPGANASDVIVKSYDSNVIDINGQAVVTGCNAGYSEIVAATRDGKIQTKSRVFVGSETEVVSAVLDNIWTKSKEFLAGESFKVKVLTATCGVRG